MPSSSLVEVKVEVGVEVEVGVGVKVGVEVEFGRCSLDGVKILFRSGVGGGGWEDELKNKTKLSQS